MKNEVVNRLLDLSNKLLSIFSLIVDKFNLTTKIMDSQPWLGEYISAELLTLLLTVVIGIIVITSIYMVLINISKMTLNFLIFLKWSTVCVLLFGIVYNLILGG